MSWKIYLIVITNTINTQLSEIPKKLGIETLAEKEKISMLQAQYQENGISIGKYEDKIFIVSQQYVFDLVEKKDYEIENKIKESFPNSEIAILTSAYGVNGYRIIQNKQTIRVKVGFDLRPYVDYGEKLDEEIEAYNEISNNKELIAEIKEYASVDLPAIIELYSAEETVFKLSKRYFKKRIDEDGSDFDKITLVHYE